MTTPPGLDEAVEAGRDALLREHHELFRAGQRAVGVTPLSYDELSDRSKRLKHQQMDPLADAAVRAAYPVIAEAARTAALDEAEAAANAAFADGFSRQVADFNGGVVRAAAAVRSLKGAD